MRGWMTPVEAEKELKMKPSARGLSLLRAIQRREKERRCRIAESNGKAGRARRYRINMRALRKHCPELCEDAYDRTAKSAAEAMQRVERHLAEVVDERIEQHPKVKELQRRSVETIGLVNSLATQVEQITGVHRGARSCTA